MKLFLFFAMLSTPAFAETQKIEVLGQSVEVSAVDYIDGHLYSFTVVAPVTLKLPRGNQITVMSEGFLHPNGQLALVVGSAPQVMHWKSADGRTLDLTCNPRFQHDFGTFINRMIAFYDNGEYKTGCELASPANFATAAGLLAVKGEVDLSPDSRLLYAAEASGGEALVGDARVSLVPGTEIALFPNGRPRFFTPASGAVFTVNHPVYGPMEFGQRAGLPVSISFLENGLVERGILGRPLTKEHFPLELPAGAGLIFSDDGREIETVIFDQPRAISVEGHDAYTQRLLVKNKSRLLDIVLTQDFTFLAGTGEMVTLPARTPVSLNFDLRYMSAGETPPPPVAR